MNLLDIHDYWLDNEARLTNNFATYNKICEGMYAIYELLQEI